MGCVAGSDPTSGPLERQELAFLSSLFSHSRHVKTSMASSNAQSVKELRIMDSARASCYSSSVRLMQRSLIDCRLTDVYLAIPIAVRAISLPPIE